MSYLRPSGGTFTTKGPEIDQHIRDGITSTWTYEGTEDEMETQRAIELASGAIRVIKRPNGQGLWELVASYPFEGDAGSDEPQDIHEIEVQVEQIPVWNSTRLREYFLEVHSGSSAADREQEIAMVSAAINRLQSGNWDDTTTKIPDIAQAVTDLAVDTTYDTVTAALFKRVAGGVESALEYREVYRRTITAADPSQIQASYEGVGKIWTTAEVEAWEGVPSGTAWFGLQPAMQWLKAPPTVQAVAFGKTQIQYYYTEFKQATNLLYDAYGTATMLD